MIISASYKTDIPTFYGEWFINRIRAGYCKVVNPYNARVSRVSLRRPDVDAFVFWTKNLGPFLQRLDTVREMGFPFVIQYTINGYPRELESAVTDASRSVEHVRTVRRQYGPKVVVWRYDTILFTSLTDHSYHLQNFARLAASLEGAVDEVVISYAHLYQKSQRNMDRSAAEHSFTWWDPELSEKRELTSELVRIAQGHGIALTVCSQPDYIVPGAGNARCVDAARISEIAGVGLNVPLKGNRKECGCFESRDIGEYDTCPHGCIYCYAVRRQELAKKRFQQHDPNSEFLFTPPGGGKETHDYGTLPLFSAPPQ